MEYCPLPSDQVGSCPIQVRIRKLLFDRDLDEAHIELLPS